MERERTCFKTMASSELRLALPREDLIKLAEPVRQLLAGTPYETPPGDAVSVKSMLESLLPPPKPQKEAEESRCVEQTRDFCLCCAALASAEGEETPHLYWIPKELSRAGRSALSELSDYLSMSGDRELVCALMPSLLPSLKSLIKDSCVDAEADDVVASSAKTPVIYAIVSAHQFRWLVTQVTQFIHLQLAVIICGARSYYSLTKSVFR